jgi:hypothetical protein
VVFRFEPTSIRVGLVLSIVTALLLLGLAARRPDRGQVSVW